jgi:hypothetical protein
MEMKLDIDDVRYASSSSSSSSSAVARDDDAVFVVSDEEYRRAVVGALVAGKEKSASPFWERVETLLEKAKTTRLLPLETRALVGALRENNGMDALFCGVPSSSSSSSSSSMMMISMVENVFESSNPTVAGELFTMREIFRGGVDVEEEEEEERDDDEDKTLSRKTMEFWEAAVSRIEFEYARKKGVVGVGELDRMEAAARRVRTRYNNFLSRYVYALDAKYREDKENRTSVEAMDNLKLRVSLLKDAVMKRKEGEASRIFSKKFALEAKHLLVELKMPSPEAVTLYQFLLAKVESRDVARRE